MINTEQRPSTLLVVGKDRFGRRLAASAADIPNVHLAQDGSLTLRRILRLLKRKSIGLGRLMLMAANQLFTRSRDSARWPANIAVITSNHDLLHLVQELRVDRVLLFRAGLIIDRQVLQSGTDVLNIHCARLPDYGGLDAIGRALRNGDLDQCATLYRVTEAIDSGEVLRERPYRLGDRGTSYGRNEDLAYETGIALAIEFLSEPMNLYESKSNSER